MSHKLKLFIIIGAIVVVLAGGATTTLLLTGESEPQTFSVSGVVTVDSLPVSDVLVSGQFFETTTDENGYYCLSGLTEQTTIAFYSEKYFFPENNDVFSTDAVFDCTNGMAYRTVNGKCTNGDESVADVQVTLKGQNKTYITFSDDDGNFSVDNLAGDVEVSAIKDGKQFFSQVSPNNSQDSIEIVSTSKFSVSFDFGDDDLLKADFVCVYNGEETAYSTIDGDFIIEKAEFGKTIKFISDDFAFDNNEFTITSKNDVKNVVVYQKYDLTGNVSCGTTVLENAEVLLDNNVVAHTDASGNYMVQGLYGTHVAKIVMQGYVEQNETITKQCNEFSPKLLKNVSIKVVVNGKQLSGANVSVGERSFLTTLYETQMNCFDGESIAVTKEGYYFEEPIVVENGKNRYVVTGQKIYSAKITLNGTELPADVAADTTSDGITIDLKQNLSNNAVSFVNGVVSIDGLYGTHNLIVNLQNYRTNAPQCVNENSANVIVEAALLHDVVCSVKSGDVVIGGAKIFVNDLFACQSDENGNFDVQLAQNDVLSVEKQGYDLFSKAYLTSEEFGGINLTYSVELSVKCGQNYVRNYSVSYCGKTEIASGKIILNGLSGNSEVSIEKDGYEFLFDNGQNSKQVVSHEVCQVAATYTAKVVVSKSKVVVEGATVIVADNENGNVLELSTDANGEVTLQGLNSAYTVIVCDYDGVRFRPDSVEISEGGTYSFADSGYSVTLKTQVGSSPLADVEISYGTRNAVTNELGEYKLNLSENAIITLSKNGYEFDSKTISLTEDDDGKTINIFATYGISGKVVSGATPLKDVNIAAGELSTTTDEQGNYALQGISVLDQEIVFQKDGFVQQSQQISGYQIVNANMFVDVLFEFASGDIVLENVSSMVNGISTSNFVLGDVVEFQKDGYSFENVTIDGMQKIIVQGSYTVSGMVKNGSDGIANVSVCDGESVLSLTDENGKFVVSGLYGEKTLSFKSPNFKINSVTVSKPTSSVVANASYNVNVKVLTNGEPLQDVSVSVRNTVIGKTDLNGLLVLENLTGKNTIVLEKKGYSFDGNFVVTQGTEALFEATYAVSGIVYVGNSTKTLSNLRIYVNENYCYTTGSNGAFSIENLSGENKVTFSLDGYKTQDIMVSQPQSLSVRMGFYVVVTFKGNDGGTIVANINDNQTVIKDSTVTLGEFYEATEINFSKEGWAFDIPNLIVTDYTQKEVTLGKAFSIGGKVTTSSGLPVVGMTIYAGNQTTETDSSGNYNFSSLMGEVQVRGAYKFTVDGKNLYTHDCAVNDTTKYTDNATVNFNSVSDTDYAFALYERNYDVRLGQYGNTAYKITGGGGVKAVAVGTTTKTSGGFIKIKDANGNILTENSNFGETILGIDPRVAVLSYYNGSSVKYASVSGEKVSGSLDPAKVSSVNYTGVTFVDCSDSELKSQYGSSANGIVIYNVNSSTVSSSAVTKNSNGTFTLTMTLSTSAAMYSNYATQINKLSGVTMSEFKKEILTFTLDSNGYVTQMIADENYIVKKKVGVEVEADTTATLTYNYTYDNITDLSSFTTDNTVVQRLLGR